jgi:hypothetical protein
MRSSRISRTSCCRVRSRELIVSLLESAKQAEIPVPDLQEPAQREEVRQLSVVCGVAVYPDSVPHSVQENSCDERILCLEAQFWQDRPCESAQVNHLFCPVCPASARVSTGILSTCFQKLIRPILQTLRDKTLMGRVAQSVAN